MELPLTTNANDITISLSSTSDWHLASGAITHSVNLCASKHQIFIHHNTLLGKSSIAKNVLRRNHGIPDE